MMLCRDDGTKAAGYLRLSAGQDADAEAAIHAMRYIFTEVDTDVVLLIDAEKAFNFLNCKVMLHNFKHICRQSYLHNQLLRSSIKVTYYRLGRDTF